MKWLWIILATISVVVASCLADTNPKDINATIGSISDLQKLAKDHAISHIEVYNLPWFIETATANNADMLKLNAKYKLVISSAETEIGRWGMESSLRKIRLDKRSRAGDLRWGFIFFDRESKEIFSIYATGMCEAGLVQGQLVTFDPAFWLWVKQQFGVAFNQALK